MNSRAQVSWEWLDKAKPAESVEKVAWMLKECHDGLYAGQATNMGYLNPDEITIVHAAYGWARTARTDSQRLVQRFANAARYGEEALRALMEEMGDGKQYQLMSKLQERLEQCCRDAEKILQAI